MVGPAVGSIVRVKKGTGSYGGRRARVREHHSEEEIVVLGILDDQDREVAIVGYDIEDVDIPLDKPMSRAKSEGRVRYVVTTGGVHCREEQDYALALKKGIAIARKIWKAGKQSEHTELWREKTSRSGTKTSRLLLTLHSRNDTEEIPG